MRRAAKVDDNQAEIVAAVRKLGGYWLHLHTLKNCCDGLMLHSGRCWAIEIKDGNKVPSKRKLTPGEESFMFDWLGHGGQWELVTCVDDIVRLINDR